jgi:hypothetical protein
MAGRNLLFHYALLYDALRRFGGQSLQFDKPIGNGMDIASILAKHVKTLDDILLSYNILSV